MEANFSFTNLLKFWSPDGYSRAAFEEGAEEEIEEGVEEGVEETMLFAAATRLPGASSTCSILSSLDSMETRRDSSLRRVMERLEFVLILLLLVKFDYLAFIQ
jgi:hypothetical protein